MEQIKEAFYKVKQDIDSLKEELSTLSKELMETKESLVEVCEILKRMSKKSEEDKEATKSKAAEMLDELSKLKKLMEENPQISTPTHNIEIQTDRQQFSTSSTPLNPLKTQNWAISTGNEGVPTDRQTDQQTDQRIAKGSYNKNLSINNNSINDAAQILDSLDNLKKEIRLKFKRLTDQEFSVFSTIYQLSEEKGYTDYKNLSETLNLTESSIRDYIGRLIKKGIPLDKIKINNKTIHLSISQSLKRVVTLPTILQLRAI